MNFVSPRTLLGSSALILVALVACASDGDDGDVRGGEGSGGRDGGAASEAGAPPDTNAKGPQPSDGGPTCGSASVKGGFVGSRALTVGGMKRTYELYVPGAYDGRTTYPLVFVFHGDGGDGAGIRSAFDLEQESGGDAIFVYPDGLDNTWVIDVAVGLKADVAFVDAVAADLSKSLCTDEARIFAVGFSKGAYFTNMLACLSKSRIRAVVTHSGGGPFPLEGSGTSTDEKGNLKCPAPSVAALQVQGSSDDAVPLGEGKKARDYWRRTNGCKTTSVAIDPSPCTAYDGCTQGRPEVWCQIPGMGHTVWPEYGTKVTWAFLKTK